MTARPTRDLSVRHEQFVADLLGGRRTPNSGATWRDKGDGSQPWGEGAYSLGWDGKATRSASTTLKLADWHKLVEQLPTGRRPMMPIRFYLDDRLTRFHDLALLDLHDVAELVEQANLLSRIRDQGCLDGSHLLVASSTCSVCGADSYDQPGSEP